jgi:hypothetical protein
MDFRETLSDVFDFLLSRQLIELGSLEEEGFSAWIGTKNELVGRAISECSSFNWEPLGAGFWIRNTPLGDAAARSIDGNKSV